MVNEGVGDDGIPWYDNSFASGTQLPVPLNDPGLSVPPSYQFPYRSVSPRPPASGFSLTNPFYRHVHHHTSEPHHDSIPSVIPPSSSKKEEQSIRRLAPLERQSSLGDYFSVEETPRTSYTDTELVEIARLLRETKRERWSHIPRIYTVLRLIGQLSAIELFLDEGLNDLWFPFTVAQLPPSMSALHKNRFIGIQQMVL